MKSKVITISVLILLLLFPFVFGEIVYDNRSTDFAINYNPNINPDIQSTGSFEINNSKPVYFDAKLDSSKISFYTNDINIYSCQELSFNIYLENNNLVPISVNLDSSLDWITLSQKSITVNPHSTEVILAWIRAPCGKKGSYNNNLFFIVQNLESNFKLRQKINIEKQSNIQVLKKITYTNECPAKEIKYVFQVSNIGSFTENYEISLNKYSANFGINPSKFKLSSGESIDVTVFGKFPESYYGKYDFRANVKALNNNLNLNVDLSADVLRCHNFILNGSSNLDVCQDGNGFYENYYITNLANFSNDYDVYLKGNPSYVWLQGDYIKLDSKQTGLIPIGINPQTKKGQLGKQYLGNNSFKLIVESNLGDLILEKNINLKVNECYSIGVLANKTEKICRGDKPYLFEVKNNGIFSEKIDLKLLTNLKEPFINELSLDVYSINLDAFSSKQVNLNFNSNGAIDLKDGKFTVKVVALIKNKSKIYNEVELEFEKASDSECYDIRVLPKKIYLESINDTAVLKYQELLEITNLGIRNATYSLNLFDEKNMTTLNNSLIYLDIGQTKTVLLTINPNNNTQTKNTIKFVGTTNDVSFVKDVQIYYNYSANWFLYFIIAFLCILIILLLLLLFKYKKSKIRKSKVKDIGDLKKESPKSLIKKSENKEVVKKDLSTKTSLSKNKLKDETSNNYSSTNKSRLWFLLILLILLFLTIFFFALKSRFSELDSLNNESNATLNNQSINESIFVIDNGTNLNNSNSFLNTLKNLFNFSRYNFFKKSKIDLTNETINNTTIDNNTLINESSEFDNGLNPDANSQNIFESFLNSFKSNESHATQIYIERPCPDAKLALEYVERNNLEQYFEYQIIPRNSILKLNLSKVFFDPDNEELLYSSRDMANISVAYFGSEVYLVPDKDFCGVRVTKFRAEDASGEFAESPYVAIIVTQEEKFLEKYSTYILIILLALALILLLLVAYDILPEIKDKSK